ncbi:MAG: phosphate ABC transporter substrate-binding protein [Methanomicrobiales archaeon]|nr:phosphate ABC transporter substrate-binding protein [Methanomicrobiales archaeon]
MSSTSKRTAPVGLTALVACCLLGAAFLGGCVGSETDNATTAPAAVTKLAITGSTTVLPLAEQAAEAYMDAHPDADIQVSGGGSSVGVQAVGEGTADIGMASRDLKDSERETYPDLVSDVVARDGIAVIVHKDNPVASLTLAQIKAIYKGGITNWNEVGGGDLAIVVVGRDSSSGTREFFYESVMGKEEFVATQLEKNSNGAVKQTVEQTPGAIGYVGLGYVDAAIGSIAIDTGGVLVEPTVDNVLAGKYPVARSLLMITQGEAAGLAKDFIDFLLSAEGQQIVAEEGFVPVA